jgi:hypothetical protein
MRLILLVLACASACDNTHSLMTSPEVTLTLEAPVGSMTATPSGMLIAARATATSEGVAVQSAPIAFGTSMSGLAFSPPSATTESDGTATSMLVLPFGSQVLATASSQGGGFDQQTLAAPSIVLTLNTTPGVITAASAQYKVTATVMAGGHFVSGVSVAFAQYGTNSNSNPFTPAASTTDTNGQASSFVMFDPSKITSFLAVLTVAGVPVACTVPAMTMDERCQ